MDGHDEPQPTPHDMLCVIALQIEEIDSLREQLHHPSSSYGCCRYDREQREHGRDLGLMAFVDGAGTFVGRIDS